MQSSAAQDKELSAERVFLIFTTVGLVRAPLGGVAMGFTAVVDGLAAFRRLNAFVSQRRPAVLWERKVSRMMPDSRRYRLYRCTSYSSRCACAETENPSTCTRRTFSRSPKLRRRRSTKPRFGAASCTAPRAPKLFSSALT